MFLLHNLCIFLICCLHWYVNTMTQNYLELFAFSSSAPRTMTVSVNIVGSINMKPGVLSLCMLKNRDNVCLFQACSFLFCNLPSPFFPLSAFISPSSLLSCASVRPATTHASPEHTEIFGFCSFCSFCLKCSTCLPPVSVQPASFFQSWCQHLLEAASTLAHWM